MFKVLWPCIFILDIIEMINVAKVDVRGDRLSLLLMSKLYIPYDLASK